MAGSKQPLKKKKKVKGMLPPTHYKSTKGFIQKSHNWTHFHSSRKPNWFFKTCCEKRQKKLTFILTNSRNLCDKLGYPWINNGK
jgi:hypothetical protein